MASDKFLEILQGVAKQLEGKLGERALTLKFDLGADGIYRLVIRGNQCTVERGDGDAVTTVVMPDAEQASLLMTGQLNPSAAHAEGTLSVRGSVAALAVLFQGQREAPPEPASEEAIRAGVRRYVADKCDPSYVLYNSRNLEVANLIDLEGNLIHAWSYPQGFTWHYAELLPNGHLAAIVKETEGVDPGMVVVLDWESNLVRRFDVAAHHDFDFLENGNVVILCREYVDNRDVYVPSAEDPAPNAKSDVYLEIAPDGSVVWEWHADEHALSLLDYVDLTFPRPDRDWAHTNTVEVLRDNPLGRVDPRFQAGNVIFSMRHVDTIGVIDKASGRVVWAWGPGAIEKQHMPTMLDNGHLLVYDNGCETGRTRVIEMDPRSETILWQYAADPPESFFSFARGSNQRLPNGNTHIADSDNGRLFEVTPDGEMVWEFLNPDLTRAGGRPMPLYRSMRYARAFVDPFLRGEG
jgi:hypothetical protein